MGIVFPCITGIIIRFVSKSGILMSESIKHRLIGFLVLFAAIIAVVPFLFDGERPAWMVAEDNKTFEIPKVPATSTVTLEEKPKPAWTKQVELNKVAVNHSAELFVKEAEQVFSSEQYNPVQLAQQTIKKLDKSSQPKLSTSTSRHTINKTKSLEHYSLRVATFSKPKLAQQLIEKLTKQGLEAFSKDWVSAKGQHYTLVMVGNKKSKKQIKALQQSINQTLKVKSIIIKQKA